MLVTDSYDQRKLRSVEPGKVSGPTLLSDFFKENKTEGTTGSLYRPGLHNVVRLD